MAPCKWAPYGIYRLSIPAGVRQPPGERAFRTPSPDLLGLCRFALATLAAHQLPVQSLMHWAALRRHAGGGGGGGLGGSLCSFAAQPPGLPHTGRASGCHAASMHQHSQLHPGEICFRKFAPLRSFVPLWPGGGTRKSNGFELSSPAPNSAPEAGRALAMCDNLADELSYINTVATSICEAELA